MAGLFCLILKPASSMFIKKKFINIQKKTPLGTHMDVFRWIKLVKPGVKKSNQFQNCQILSHWFMMWTPASDYSPDFMTIPSNKNSPK